MRQRAIISGMPGARVRPNRRFVPGLAAAATSYIVAAALGPAAWADPVEAGDAAVPCRADQVAVTASPTQAAVGHRALTLTFSLAGGAAPCTLTGYPWVGTGAGGDRIDAEPTPRGYMGGLPPSVEALPTTTLSITAQGQAIVE